MYNALMISLIVVSILIILLVIMQPSKSNAASTLTGGGDDGTVKTKARGFEAFLIRATTVLGVLFFVIALALAYLSAK
ncbi:preprotein translocase subunit SecG [Facklamia sp. 7083-14-GEN3]|uniref:preprotein translocase subunit SecG n=1 Tax=Facklamia sp. 7083-14-GEN3 TaxID=2973478 RepID=UPI00215C902A|nr:preprotein translocase subunit SecG [Facklamia sp. 7083-14-GEN3]MCR8969341.1 preprotein translocase subunit SecG [Facklamia sp. 7083-14-GEN3]